MKTTCKARSCLGGTKLSAVHTFYTPHSPAFTPHTRPSHAPNKRNPTSPPRSHTRSGKEAALRYKDLEIAMLRDKPGPTPGGPSGGGGGGGFVVPRPLSPSPPPGRKKPNSTISVGPNGLEPVTNAVLYGINLTPG